LDKQNSWNFRAQAGQPMFMIMTLLSFVAWCSFPFFIFLFGLVLKKIQKKITHLKRNMHISTDFLVRTQR